MAVVCDDECLLLPLEDVVAHSHGLGGSRPLIKEGRIGHGQACDIGNHGLVIQQTLQSSLRYLGLIGGVLSVPSRVLHDVPQDHRRHESIIIAHPDEGLVDLVHGGQSLHVLQHLSLGEPRIELRELDGVDSDRFRDRGINKGVEAVKSAGLRHTGLLLWGGRVVTAGESVVRPQGLHGNGPGLLEELGSRSAEEGGGRVGAERGDIPRRHIDDRRFTEGMVAVLLRSRDDAPQDGCPVGYPPSSLH